MRISISNSRLAHTEYYGISTGADVIVRSYQLVPWRVDLTDYTPATFLYNKAIDAELTQMYIVYINRLT